MTEDDYKLPDGSIDIERFRRDFEAADISLEQLQEAAAKMARKHGKSLDDIVVELIQSGKRAEDIPKIIDALAAIPRLSMISLLEDFVDAAPAEQQNIELVINKLTEDPLFFGKDITPRLQTAMENNRFAEELRTLQNNKKYRQKLFSIAPPNLTADKRMQKLFEATKGLPPPRLSSGN
jgi:hypothetical protein